ncbi:hypothetical protein VTK73DRAFT_4489 [Phialemonium thermophilum]|uniref:Uncharacterized protein n=1 Tax=Phialemonium thermophilum TaxID=223376 RepID=A0ABR3V8B0_9PEZI
MGIGTETDACQDPVGISLAVPPAVFLFLGFGDVSRASSLLLQGWHRYGSGQGFCISQGHRGGQPAGSHCTAAALRSLVSPSGWLSVPSPRPLRTRAPEASGNSATTRQPNYATTQQRPNPLHGFHGLATPAAAGRDPVARPRAAGHPLQLRALVLRRLALLRPHLQQRRRHQPGAQQPEHAAPAGDARGLRGPPAQHVGPRVRRRPGTRRDGPGHGHRRLGHPQADPPQAARPGRRDHRARGLLHRRREHLHGAHAGGHLELEGGEHAPPHPTPLLFLLCVPRNRFSSCQNPSDAHAPP